MSITSVTLNIDLENTYDQYLEYNSELKNKYGEVNTPFWFINKMLSIIPDKYYKDKTMKWLDAGAGHGNYSICLFYILFKSLVSEIPNDAERSQHILTNMIYMVEINPDNVQHLRKVFGLDSNIIYANYLEWNTATRFDFIIGNPPYNCNGVKKVPTKQQVDKKEDGKTIWCEFIKKNLSLLKPDGKMNTLIPSIWMKPDKAGIYELLIKNRIEKLHSLNANDVNKLFNYHVQTPICYFLLTKCEFKVNTIELYDSISDKYIDFKLSGNIPIPLCFSSIVNKFLSLVDKYGKLNVIKTNMPRKNVEIAATYSEHCPFKNIHTTLLNSRKEPVLDIKYSNEQLAFHGEPKIVMAHKMYGFPFIDRTGVYGICARDNYVIKGNELSKLEIIKEFLSTELILFIFETTRYRMRYLEKYVFDYIPDFSNMPDAIEMYTNKKVDIYKLVGLSIDEIRFVDRYYKVKYKYFEN
jgi:hypothetical protein